MDRNPRASKLCKGKDTSEGCEVWGPWYCERWHVMDGQEFQVSSMMDYESCLGCRKKNCSGAERRNIQGATGNEALYLCHWSPVKKLCLGSMCQRHCIVQFLFCLLNGDWFTDLESNTSPYEQHTAFPVPLFFIQVLIFKITFHT